MDYASTAKVAISSYSIADLLTQIKLEERARFERQIERSNEQLLEIGQRHLQLQALPIGNPDPLPKRRVVQRKESWLGLMHEGLPARSLRIELLLPKKRLRE